CSGGSTSLIPVLSPINCITTTSNSVSLNKIMIKPNPFEQILMIETADFLQCEILTLHGILLMKSKSKSLDLGFLPSGTYLLKVQTSKKQVFEKIVKQ
ncbi:MAG: T9SS type A sorting domain-containing protein, partial [Cytophagales bacterium]